jgi:hypothetical protein
MSAMQFLIRTCGVACIATLAATCSGNASREPQPAPGTAAAQSAAGDAAGRLEQLRFISSDLPLLPPGIATAARPPEVTKAVFAFAARRPDVLSYMPCFCGCERGGHRGNHDCFVAKRNAEGKVTAWEPHGLVCEVCIDVGQQAMQMTNAGASLTQIREAIEKKYAGAPNHTPTPAPPHKGGTH